MLNRLADLFSDIRRASSSTPGYYHVVLPPELSSHDLRTAMITVGDHLIAKMRAEAGISLDYFSLGRVDQKRTTKIHLDGAPPKSILILGYEPSPIASSVAVIDFSRYCRDQGISTTSFLARYNPMYSDGVEFAAYTTSITGFVPTSNNLLVINSSSCDCGSESMCGVMHWAGVEPGSGPRVINTANLAELAGTGQHALDEMDKMRFVELSDLNVSYGG